MVTTLGVTQGLRFFGDSGVVASTGLEGIHSLSLGFGTSKTAHGRKRSSISLKLGSYLTARSRRH
jgi:hypothetical protein